MSFKHYLNIKMTLYLLKKVSFLLLHFVSKSLVPGVRDLNFCKFYVTISLRYVLYGSIWSRKEKIMKFVYPCKKYLDSYNKAYDDFNRINEHHYSFDNAKECDIVKKYYNYRHGINLKKNYVSSTTYWLIDKDKFIGQINIRHQLNDSLLKRGGHIGFGVAYEFWKQGYGTKMLAMALKKAKNMGINKVLITCDEDNIGSSKVIENNGGKLENIVENIVDDKKIYTKRYWIEL
jgi:predicted acetyltransferase